jgi:hypothetical protein
MIEHQGESGEAKAAAELATEIEKPLPLPTSLPGNAPQADQGQRQKHHHGAAAPLDQGLIQALFAGAGADSRGLPESAENLRSRRGSVDHQCLRSGLLVRLITAFQRPAGAAISTFRQPWAPGRSASGDPGDGRSCIANGVYWNNSEFLVLIDEP